MNLLKYLILVLIVPLYSQFGKNIVQYKSFDWHYLQTEYFDIYYYDNDINAQYVAKEADIAYHNISHALDWNLKNRIPIIVYNSHNDFQQTNVIDMFMPEGVGGVTELYKNRIVIPYDGVHQDFQHVIHHELVHAFINDYIYKGNAMNMQDASINPIPLWMNEGLAEFLSDSWTVESDMWIRDLVINGKALPTFNELRGYLAYRGGHSVWKFLIEVLDKDYINNVTPSPTIIATIFKSIAGTKDLNTAFEKAINLDLLELEEAWHKYLKENYFLDINERNYLDDIALSLIDLKKNNANYNIAPSISPDGNNIAFYSNQDGIMSLCVMPSNCEECSNKSITKILKGEKSANVEQFHILKPGISWSPDSRSLVAAIKSKGKDVLFIINLGNHNFKSSKENNNFLSGIYKPRYKKEKLIFNEKLKGIFQPSWNPVLKDWIAFIGSDGNQSDVYLFNLKTKQLSNVTNDIFTDKDVTWTKDGKKLLFSSDRQNNINNNSDKQSNNWGAQYDLYSIALETFENKNFIRLTNTPDNEIYPINIQDSILAFISDKNGINNIYILNDTKNIIMPITNVFTGITQLSGSGKELYFTGFEKNKFGIYKLDSTSFNENKKELRMAKWKEIFKNYDYALNPKINKKKKSYKNYIFKNNQFIPPNNQNKKDTQNVIVQKDSINNYIAKKYRTRFTMDIGQMYYGFGFNGSDYSSGNGMAQFVFSDIMGDHKIYLGTELNVNLKRSDYSFAYRYLPNLIDWTFQFFHDAVEFSDGYLGDNYEEQIALYENFRISLNASRPISRFVRFDVGLGYHLLTKTNEILRQNNYGYYDLEESEFDSQNSIATIDLKYVWDNTGWSYTYPIRGTRFYMKYQTSPLPNYNANLISFDGRFYKPLFNGLSLLIRNFSGLSWGEENQKFYLGSSPSFYTSDNFNVNQYYQNQNLDEFYFSEHVMPIRGVPFMYKMGDNVMAFNFELRAPFLIYYFPAIKWIGELNGIGFIDIGVTWNDNENLPSISNEENWLNRENGGSAQGWVMTYGWGPRFILLGLPFQVNYAWQFNPITKEKSAKRYEITIGFDL